MAMSEVEVTLSTPEKLSGTENNSSRKRATCPEGGIGSVVAVNATDPSRLINAKVTVFDAPDVSVADKRFKEGLTTRAVLTVLSYGSYVNPRAAAGCRAARPAAWPGPGSMAYRMLKWIPGITRPALQPTQSLRTAWLVPSCFLPISLPSWIRHREMR